jgi:hypothetical protein
MNANLLPVTIEIKTEWQEIAYNFATEQHQEQQLEIFQNTLAVLGLQEYLQWGEIETALTSSYSWHPYSRILTGWADLLLPEYGRLLCCLKQEQNYIELPDILPVNCIGCVVFEIVPDGSSLQLQGFLPRRLLDLEVQTATNYFFLEDMEAIASLFDELYLLTEERLLVEREMLQLIARYEDLEDYFLPLLDSENIMDIVGRLNRLFYESIADEENIPENIFIIDENEWEDKDEDDWGDEDEDEVEEITDEVDKANEETQERMVMLSQPDMSPLMFYSPMVREDIVFYNMNTQKQKINEITQDLTEKLLGKLQQLRDEIL